MSADSPRGCVFVQDLANVYRDDFGIDSQGNFYRRLKAGQDLFEEADREEIPESIRSKLSGKEALT